MKEYPLYELTNSQKFKDMYPDLVEVINNVQKLLYGLSLLVTDLDTIYKFEIENFENDLTKRSIIERELIKLPTEIVQEVRKVLNELDKKFLDGTFQLNGKLIDFDDDGLLEEALYSRAPIKRDEDFDKYIQHLIIPEK